MHVAVSTMHDILQSGSTLASHVNTSMRKTIIEFESISIMRFRFWASPKERNKKLKELTLLSTIVLNSQSVTPKETNFHPVRYLRLVKNIF